MFVVCCLFVGCWLLVVGCWFLFVVCLLVVGCLLFVVCCLLFVVCCLLFVVCCLLFTFYLEAASRAETPLREYPSGFQLRRPATHGSGCHCSQQTESDRQQTKPERDTEVDPLWHCQEPQDEAP